MYIQVLKPFETKNETYIYITETAKFEMKKKE